MHLGPAREFYAKMDASNIDLKAFSDEFYVRQCGAKLHAVLDLIAMVHHETGCWVELTTLLIPGLNDSDVELTALANWVAKELGPDVPLHFSAFHPDWKMREIPATPPATLARARRIALDAGLHYVYTGNVHDTEGGTSFCPGCHRPVVVRDWYRILRYELSATGHCLHCGKLLAGRYDRFENPFGPQRIPVRLQQKSAN
jgi:pyruvate formate lyase activating enzyme